MPLEGTWCAPGRRAPSLRSPLDSRPPDPRLAGGARRASAGGSARVVVTGELVEVRRALPQTGDGPAASRRTHIPARGGGRRQPPVGQSEASRARLRRLVLRLRPERPAVVTLTYPDPAPMDPSAWARDWRAFAARLGRAFPSASAVWALHIVPRRWGACAGRHAPHRHALVYVPGGMDRAAVEALGAFCAGAWGELTGGRAHVAPARDADAIRARLYLVGTDKTPDADERAALAAAFPLGTGRAWGVVHRAALPLAPSHVAHVSDDEAARVLEAMRDEVDARMQGTGRRSRLSPSLFAGHAHAPALAARLASTGASSASSRRASRRPDRAPRKRPCPILARQAPDRPLATRSAPNAKSPLLASGRAIYRLSQWSDLNRRPAHYE